MSHPVPIIVWCHPRSCSTAFERALMQRKDTHVFHEPLGDPFYFSENRPCQRYSDSVCRSGEHWNTSVQSVMESLLDPSAQEGKDAPKYVFIKDMAQYIFPASKLRELHPDSTVYHSASSPEASKGLADKAERENPTVLPTWLLRRFKHTFLIRTPEKSVPSYWKCVEEKAAGFEYFDGAEAGYAELRILYDWIADPESSFNTEKDDERPGKVQEQPQPPPLIDASTLLAHPQHTVSTYCAAVGIPFEPSMLSWESGPVKEFEKWGTYHKGAENSTGFKADEPKKDTGVKKQLPAEVTDTIEKSMKAYDYLYAKATITPP